MRHRCRDRRRPTALPRGFAFQPKIALDLVSSSVLACESRVAIETGSSRPFAYGSTLARGFALTLGFAFGLGAAEPSARALPPPGPPPDPTRGETYDGRPPRPEPPVRRVALAAPRALLYPPRFLLRLLERPITAALREIEEPESGATPAETLARRGVSPMALWDGGGPWIGLKFWSLDLFGRGAAASSVEVRTGGWRMGELQVGVEPNVTLAVGPGLSLRVRRQLDESFYGLAGRVPAGADADELERRFAVTAFDARAWIALRPNRGAGRWRAIASGGVGMRDYGPGEGGPSPTEEEAPGFVEGTTFARVSLAVERIGRFDASRRAPAFDLRFEATPTVGLADDESRYVTLVGDLTLAVPTARGRVALLRALVESQESWGDDPVPFAERVALGGREHRGFAPQRFRGGALALASLEYRWPVLWWLDGFAFLEYGGAFEERFAGFSTEAMRAGFGGGVRLYRGRRAYASLLFGWGVGDGPRLAFSFEAGP